MKMTEINPVPQCDPGASYFSHETEIQAAVNRVMVSGWYVLGPEVAAFEASFAEWAQAKFSVGLGSGTDAVEIALRLLEVGPGDIVITVSHTAVATAAAICRTGAIPWFVDITADYTMSPDSLRQALLQAADKDLLARVKAVIPVHLYGHPAAMQDILEVCSGYDLPIIEDCAQAHGAMVDGKTVGSFGVAGCYSFYPTKNLGALGDGGAITLNDDNLRRKALMLRQYGWEDRHSRSMGVNSRLDEMQAAILRVKLQYLELSNRRRREIAARYLQNLPEAVRPHVASNVNHVFHQFVIRTGENQAASFRQSLESKGIHTAVHYPLPVHQQDAFSDIRYSPVSLSETNRLVDNIVSLPMYPELSDEQVMRVCDVLNHHYADTD